MHSFTVKFISLFASALLLSNTALANTAPSLFTNVPQVTQQKLTPEYWLTQKNQASSTKNTSVDDLMLSREQINRYNQKQYDSQRYLKNPLTYSEQIQGSKIKAMINRISKPASAPRYYQNKQQLSAKDYQHYIDKMALTDIGKQQTIAFGLVTKRASLRTFPTTDRVFKKDINTDLDRFQETAVFPGEAVAVLHYSKDKKWAFVQNYHYRAWLETSAIAIGSKAQVDEYISQKSRLIVTGAKVFTNYNPSHQQVSELQLDMGVSLPLLSHEEFAQYQLSGQNPYASHVVILPSRLPTGKLAIVPALIAKSADVNLGYLPFSHSNVIKQSFKFLGERYGWGHDFNGRDCSGFIGEIFKTFGLHMPRNTSQQGYGEIGINTRFTKQDSIEVKQNALAQLEVGDLIYLSGHVAMVIGYDEAKQPFIIHDVYGLQYQTDNVAKESATQVKGVLNGVSVTPILPFTHYISTMYNIQRLGK
ncbi:SH3 domain-containing protein [Thalassotalea atypica]|uniref:C40 family peptidase n=1 Tax=Thalassotalea atypica TaxID=2054316 RepID=UPI002573B7B5|nr:SH3 domain-containing protein [Thalassotalea atypica]